MQFGPNKRNVGVEAPRCRQFRAVCAEKCHALQSFFFPPFFLAFFGAKTVAGSCVHSRVEKVQVVFEIRNEGWGRRERRRGFEEKEKEKEGREKVGGVRSPTDFSSPDLLRPLPFF